MVGRLAKSKIASDFNTRNWLFTECLYYVSKALELELYYIKAYAFRNKIYAEEPTLKEDAAEFFQNW